MERMKYEGLPIGSAAPDFSLPAVDSRTYSLGSFKDKPILVVERSKRKGYNFPYLRDESQKVAESYGAVCTPDFFVFDSARKLRYRGKLDDSKEPKAVKKHVMREVLDAVLAGKQPPMNFVPPMGCSIKWKSGHWR